VAILGRVRQPPRICNRSGIQVLDWTEVRAIHFEYHAIYNPDEVETYCTTDLVITLCNGGRVSLRVGVLEDAANYSEKILQTLLQGLQSHQSGTRRSAAVALGRFGPDGVRRLRQDSHDQTRAGRDAAEAILKIEEAMPYLQEATADEDEAVRKAATDALRSIQRDGYG